MRQHPLFFFFLLAYAFSWIISIPYVLSSWGILSSSYNLALLLFALKYAGPTVAAIIVTSVIERKRGLLRLWHRVTLWRAGWMWYLSILVGFPSLFLLAIIVQPGMLASFQGLTRGVLLNYPLAFIATFLTIALPEEIGWRGFALPRMQPHYGPLRGTLLLGLLWGFWHLLYFLTPDHGGGLGIGAATVLVNFLIFVLLMIALTILFTWVFNHTQGSVFIASVLQTSFDTPQVVLIPLFLAVNETTLNLAGLIGFGVPALLIVALTRGRLGYREDLAQLQAGGD